MYHMLTGRRDPSAGFRFSLVMVRGGPWGGDGGVRGGMYDGAGRGRLDYGLAGAGGELRHAEARVPWASSHHSASDGTKNRAWIMKLKV